MPGKLVFVSGISGAGKTTLINGALKTIPNLIYLKTTTTRPIREGEERSLEYIFVGDDEYHSIKSKSTNWDETEYAGYKYGADVELVKNDLQKGTNVIGAVAPEIDTIKAMAKLYETEPITVWIDTSHEITAKRVKPDAIRSSRTEDGSAKIAFDYDFKPNGEIEVDISNFTKLIHKIIT